uniref:high mobility group nucleosome-binding domain-containing protein 5-like n=1 Tax=Myxine glutinosa TaxID=7769 RepID=UPI00358FF609
MDELLDLNPGQQQMDKHKQLVWPEEEELELHPEEREPELHPEEGELELHPEEREPELHPEEGELQLQPEEELERQPEEEELELQPEEEGLKLQPEDDEVERELHDSNLAGSCSLRSNPTTLQEQSSAGTKELRFAAPKRFSQRTRRVSCSECNQSFTSLVILKLHIERTHGETSQQKS